LKNIKLWGSNLNLKSLFYQLLGCKSGRIGIQKALGHGKDKKDECNFGII
jgi:hypothetical protein